jgi:hypothetical protein
MRDGENIGQKREGDLESGRGFDSNADSNAATHG